MAPFRTRLTAVALSAGLVLAACSSGGGSGESVSDEGKPYAEAIAANFTTSEDPDDFVLEDDQADCIGARTVNIIGVDAFEKAGVTPADLGPTSDTLIGDVEVDDKQANEIYDSFKKCDVDLRAIMFESFAQDDDMTDEQKKCLEGALDEDTLRAFVVTAMVKGDDESPEAMRLMGAIMGCAFMGMDEGDFDMNFDEDFSFEEDFEFDDN